MQISQMPQTLQPIMDGIFEALADLGLAYEIDFADHELLARAGFSITGVDVVLIEETAHFSLDCDYPADRLKVSIDCGKRAKSYLDESLFSALCQRLRDQASVSLCWGRCPRLDSSS